MVKKRNTGLSASKRRSEDDAAIPVAKKSKQNGKQSLGEQSTEVYIHLTPKICFYFSMENPLPKASTLSTPTPATTTPVILTPVIPTPIISTPIILNPNSLWNPTHIPPDVEKTILSQAAHRGYLHESDITLIRNNMAFIVCCYLA
ncbi:hypothetical protein PLEOSDRAFT_165473 [Pleurotus ostreatus PC15]|uniref:Uncharacterized protein n=1 Tax=Pleurotus ostreatus (strain PC15) TaxID=1137138 RepID=A0A067NVW3_PLEO1|nr:hypothetical protein PLEOSDRAFT_165473 [Pleurotus ostreatus PC15]